MDTMLSMFPTSDNDGPPDANEDHFGSAFTNPDAPDDSLLFLFPPTLPPGTEENEMQSATAPASSDAIDTHFLSQIPKAESTFVVANNSAEGEPAIPLPVTNQESPQPAQRPLHDQQKQQHIGSEASQPQNQRQPSTHLQQQAHPQRLLQHQLQQHAMYQQRTTEKGQQRSQALLPARDSQLSAGRFSDQEQHLAFSHTGERPKYVKELNQERPPMVKQLTSPTTPCKRRRATEVGPISAQLEVVGNTHSAHFRQLKEELDDANIASSEAALKHSAVVRQPQLLASSNEHVEATAARPLAQSEQGTALGSFVPVYTTLNDAALSSEAQPKVTPAKRSANYTNSSNKTSSPSKKRKRVTRVEKPAKSSDSNSNSDSRSNSNSVNRCSSSGQPRKPRTLAHMEALARSHAPDVALTEGELRQIAGMHESDYQLLASRELYHEVAHFKSALSRHGYRLAALTIDPVPDAQDVEQEQPFDFVLKRKPRLPQDTMSSTCKSDAEVAASTSTVENGAWPNGGKGCPTTPDQDESSGQAGSQGCAGVPSPSAQTASARKRGKTAALSDQTSDSNGIRCVVCAKVRMLPCNVFLVCTCVLA